MSRNCTSPIKLWYSPGACSFAPHVILIESELEFDLVLAQVGHFSNDFLELNPKARVPVLELGDEVITENFAIMTMIASLTPEKQLLGKTALETARVYEWLSYLSGTIHGLGFGALWRPERFIGDSTIHPMLMQHALVIIRQGYSLIEAKFASDGRVFAVGDSLTIVDPFLFALYSWGERISLGMKLEYPHFAAWADRISKRDSFIEARKVHAKI